MADFRISANIADEKSNMTVATNTTHSGVDASIIITDTNLATGSGKRTQTSQIMRLLDRMMDKLREELQSGLDPT